MYKYVGIAASVIGQLGLSTSYSWSATNSISIPATNSSWKISAALGLKESYDNNIYFQSVGERADKGSMITMVAPKVGVGYQSTPQFKADFSYSPEMSFFHSDSEEDFTLHRSGLTLSGTRGQTAWELVDDLIVIDGSNVGPTYLGPAGAPAAGAPQVRDRRDALVERGSLRVTHRVGDWFFRPTVWGYFHDFQTVQKTTPGYQNFVDRNDFNVGTDIGRAMDSRTSLVFGYRYGQQDQSELFGNPIQYDNTYHRVLMGLEGKLSDWLKVSVSMGPEFRRYEDTVAATFGHRQEQYLYVDASVVAQVTKQDALTFTAKRFEQPSFTGRGTYIDSTYDLSWRHKFDDKWIVGAGVRGYNTDFLTARRDDWIVSFSALASYAVTPRLNAEISWLFDDAQSGIPHTEAREYNRQVIALGLRYVFK